MYFEYLKRRGSDVCQNMNYSARNFQSETLNLTSLAFPPGKRNTKRNLKTTNNVGKNPSEPVWTNCSGWRKRDKTLFEEKASCVKKRINLDSRGTTTLYCCDFQNLGKLHRGGKQQGVGQETHTCVVDLFAEEDPGGIAAHGSAEKNLCYGPAQPHGSPVTSLKGTGGNWE